MDESQSQIQKSPYCRIPVMGHSGEGQAVRTKEGSVVAKGWDWRQGLTGEEHQGIIWGAGMFRLVPRVS